MNGGCDGEFIEPAEQVATAACDFVRSARDVYDAIQAITGTITLYRKLAAMRDIARATDRTITSLFGLMYEVDRYRSERGKP